MAGLRVSRWIWLPLLLGVVAWCAAGAWLHSNQRRLLYLPRPAANPPPGEPFEVLSEGLRLRGWRLNPGQPMAVLYFGGNAEQVERRAELLTAVLPGHTVYLLPYRGYGGNPGQPSEAGLYRDALAAFDLLAGEHRDVSLIGTSLGTGVATFVASERPVARLALVMPYDSIVDVAGAHYPWLPVGWLLDDRYESWRRASRIDADVLVIIAENDRVIPRAHTDRLVAHLPRPPQVRVVPGADHDSLGGRPEFGQALAEFFRPVRPTPAGE